MKRILSILLVSTVAVSCQSGKDTQIVGKWQAIATEDPQLDKMIAEQNNFLDTFGSNTTDEQNLEIYGFTNIDSAKNLLRKEMGDYVAMQEDAIKKTTFEFRKDSIAILNFSGQLDSSKWSMNEEGHLLLSEMKNPEQTKIEMEIVTLNDTMLKVKLLGQGQQGSSVVFKPYGK